MKRISCIALVLTFAPLANADRIGSDELPAELRAFVEADTRPIWLSTADLDRDGDQDFILVLEHPAESHDDVVENQRPMLVLVREADGSLRIAGRNDAVAQCSACGGAGVGDAFQGVEASPGKFTVKNMGGDAGRWTEDYSFAWSRRDRTWQLVRVDEGSYDTRDPESWESHSSKPPRDFGRIDFSDFDPENWEGQGPR